MNILLKATENADPEISIIKTKYCMTNRSKTLRRGQSTAFIFTAYTIFTNLCNILVQISSLLKTGLSFSMHTTGIYIYFHMSKAKFILSVRI
jgi:hypothetical protein